MINDKIFQKIYDELDKYLIAGWEKLVVYLEYGKASYSFSFYIKVKDKYIKCYDLPNTSEDDLASSFALINKVLEKERNNDNKLWTNMTLIIEKNGKMHADMDYTDLADGTYQYKKDWKKKYLI